MTDPTETPFDRPDSEVGRAVSRPNAEWLVAGRGNYTDDIAFSRLLHAAFVRSPYAHARIEAIDTTVASKQPGVVRIVDGAELKGMFTDVDALKLLAMVLSE